MSLSHIACTDVLGYPDPCKDREQISTDHEDVPTEEEIVKAKAKHLQLNGFFSRQSL
jgi:hypothetical protein